MFHTKKLAERLLVPVAGGAAVLVLVGILGVGAASATTGRVASSQAGVAGGEPVSTDAAPMGSTTIRYTKIGTPPSSIVKAKYCSSDAHWAHACFARVGDVIWVDNNSGEHVKARWENWLRDSRGVWEAYRVGDCISLNWGWGYCNENFYEDSSRNAYGGRGSGIRLYTCYAAC